MTEAGARKNMPNQNLCRTANLSFISSIVEFYTFIKDAILWDDYFLITKGAEKLSDELAKETFTSYRRVIYRRVSQNTDKIKKYVSSTDAQALYAHVDAIVEMIIGKNSEKFTASFSESLQYIYSQHVLKNQDASNASKTFDAYLNETVEDIEKKFNFENMSSLIENDGQHLTPRQYASNTLIRLADIFEEDSMREYLSFTMEYLSKTNDPNSIPIDVIRTEFISRILTELLVLDFHPKKSNDDTLPSEYNTLKLLDTMNPLLVPLDNVDSLFITDSARLAGMIPNIPLTGEESTLNKYFFIYYDEQQNAIYPVKDKNEIMPDKVIYLITSTNQQTTVISGCFKKVLNGHDLTSKENVFISSKVGNIVDDRLVWVNFLIAAQPINDQHGNVIPLKIYNVLKSSLGVHMLNSEADGYVRELIALHRSKKTSKNEASVQETLEDESETTDSDSEMIDDDPPDMISIIKKLYSTHGIPFGEEEALLSLKYRLEQFGITLDDVRDEGVLSYTEVIAFGTVAKSLRTRSRIEMIKPASLPIEHEPFRTIHINHDLLFSLPNSQNQIVDFLVNNDFQGSEGGVCFGFSELAANAYLHSKIGRFLKTLALLNYYLTRYGNHISLINHLKAYSAATPECLEILAFSETIAKLQAPEHYSDTMSSFNLNQIARKGVELVQREKLCPYYFEQEVSLSEYISVVHTQESFARLLNNIRLILNEEKLSLLLGTKRHAVTLHFDARNDLWFFLDPNLLSHLSYTNNISEIADKVFNGKNIPICFNISVHMLTRENKVSAVYECITKINCNTFDEYREELFLGMCFDGDINAIKNCKLDMMPMNVIAAGLGYAGQNNHYPIVKYLDDFLRQQLSGTMQYEKILGVVLCNALRFGAKTVYDFIFSKKIAFIEVDPKILLHSAINFASIHAVLEITAQNHWNERKLLEAADQNKHNALIKSCTNHRTFEFLLKRYLEVMPDLIASVEFLDTLLACLIRHPQTLSVFIALTVGHSRLSEGCRSVITQGFLENKQRNASKQSILELSFHYPSSFEQLLSYFEMHEMLEFLITPPEASQRKDEEIIDELKNTYTIPQETEEFFLTVTQSHCLTPLYYLCGSPNALAVFLKYSGNTVMNALSRTLTKIELNYLKIQQLVEDTHSNNQALTYFDRIGPSLQTDVMKTLRQKISDLVTPAFLEQYPWLSIHFVENQVDSAVFAEKLSDKNGFMCWIEQFEPHELAYLLPHRSMNAAITNFALLLCAPSSLNFVLEKLDSKFREQLLKKHLLTINILPVMHAYMDGLNVCLNFISESEIKSTLVSTNLHKYYTKIPFIFLLKSDVICSMWDKLTTHSRLEILSTHYLSDISVFDKLVMMHSPTFVLHILGSLPDDHCTSLILKSKEIYEIAQENNDFYVGVFALLKPESREDFLLFKYDNETCLAMIALSDNRLSTTRKYLNDHQWLRLIQAKIYPFMTENFSFWQMCASNIFKKRNLQMLAALPIDMQLELLIKKHEGETNICFDIEYRTVIQCIAIDDLELNHILQSSLKEASCKQILNLFQAPGVDRDPVIWDCLLRSTPSQYNFKSIISICHRLLDNQDKISILQTRNNEGQLLIEYLLQHLTQDERLQLTDGLTPIVVHEAVRTSVISDNIEDRKDSPLGNTSVLKNNNLFFNHVDGAACNTVSSKNDPMLFH